MTAVSTEETRSRAIAIVTGVAIVLLSFDLLAWVSGDRPFDALSRAVAGTWGTPYGLGQVLYKATPLLFAGVAFDVAYRAGLFNIGVEGQITMGSIAGALALAALPGSTAAIIALPLLLVVAMGAGGAWAAIAGGLRARLGAHEVIATIMLNRVADALVPLLVARFGESGTRTHDIPAGARLFRADAFFPAASGTALSVAFPLAVAVAFAVSRWQQKARAGRETTWIGLGEGPCAAEGIPVRRRLFAAMVFSGAIAGLTATATVSGYKGYYELGMTSGAGFAGIAVALLGRGSPLGLVGAAVLIGTLQQAGLVLNATVPKEGMDVLFGVVILTVAWLSSRGRVTA